MVLRPADLFAVSTPLLFGLLTATNASRIPGWAMASTILFGVAAGGLLCRLWAAKSPHPLAQAFGNFYCILTVLLTYGCLNPLIDLVSPVPYDRALQAIDLKLFGVQPSVWLEQVHRPWLTELLFLAYCSYFVWQVGLGIVLHLRKNGDFGDYFLTVIIFYSLSFIGYILVPAIGPRFAIEHAYSGPLQGLWAADSLRASFESVPMVRDCFPSGHTGLTLIVLASAWRKRAYAFFVVMLPFAVLLIFSTLYCRFHYAIDVLSAVPFILGVFALERGVLTILPHGLAFSLAGSPRRAWARRARIG